MDFWNILLHDYCESKALIEVARRRWWLLLLMRFALFLIPIQ